MYKCAPLILLVTLLSAFAEKKKVQAGFRVLSPPAEQVVNSSMEDFHWLSSHEQDQIIY